MLRAFKTFNVDQEILSRIQDNVEQAFTPILNKQLLDYNIISGIVMTANIAKTINHGLNRTVTGWILIGVNADTRVFDSQATNLQSKATLILTSVNNATISILVF